LLSAAESRQHTKFPDFYHSRTDWQAGSQTTWQIQLLDISVVSLITALAISNINSNFYCFQVCLHCNLPLWLLNLPEFQPASLSENSKNMINMQTVKNAKLLKYKDLSGFQLALE
jgi:hypothetical protein